MILLFAAAALSGVISAMGIGGGVILIPVLTSFFGIGQKSAQYINLLYFIPVALCALAVHAKNKRLSYKTALFMGIGGVFGAIAGSSLAVNMSVGLLRRLFGVFLLIIGIYQLKGSKKQNNTSSSSEKT